MAKSGDLCVAYLNLAGFVKNENLNVFYFPKLAIAAKVWIAVSLQIDL